MNRITGGTALRILGGAITIALGALLAFPGAAMLWSMLEPVVRPSRRSLLHSYGMQIGDVTLKGWEIYVFAVLLIVMGIGLMGFGLSIFLKRKANE
jgi:hypothetical protein